MSQTNFIDVDYTNRFCWSYISRTFEKIKRTFNQNGVKIAMKPHLIIGKFPLKDPLMKGKYQA